MSDLSLTILAETANDAQAIERLHARTFGPGRFVLSAYRLREHVDHLLDLSFTARIGTLLVGSVRQLPVLIGDTKALLLGPLTVEPPFRGRGVGRALLDRALKEAKVKGHRLVLLIGDVALAHDAMAESAGAGFESPMHRAAGMERFAELSHRSVKNLNRIAVGVAQLEDFEHSTLIGFVF